jgi:hypothetical protein
LEDQRNGVRIDPIGLEIGFEICQTLLVVFLSRALRVSYKNNSVRPAQNLFPGGGILDLSWNRI